MKLTKSDLKNMFKECIRELIKEGAFDEVTDATMTEERRGKPSSPIRNAKRNTAPDAAIQTEEVRSRIRSAVGYGDLIDNEEASLEQSKLAATTLNENLKRVVEHTAHSIAGGDSKMANAYASIFADTALNTLPDLMSGEGSGLGMRREEQLRESVEPEQLQEMAVGGDVSRWAKVAFAGKK